MKRSRRWLTTLGFALAVGATAPACLVTAQGQGRWRSSGSVVVYDEPPQPQYEQVETRPGYVYIRGRWDFVNGSWVWSPGRWERERSGYAWVDGRWERRGNSWHWVEGQWSAGGGGSVTVVDNRTDNVYQRPEVVDHRTDRPPPPDRYQQPSQYPIQPPPPVRVESPGARSGYVWVTGRWDWRGGNWDWIPGHWERARPRMRWSPGRWELQGNYYVWIEGDWVQDSSQQPGTIEVHDHRTH